MFSRIYMTTLRLHYFGLTYIEFRAKTNLNMLKIATKNVLFFQYLKLTLYCIFNIIT